MTTRAAFIFAAVLAAPCAPALAQSTPADQAYQQQQQDYQAQQQQYQDDRSRYEAQQQTYRMKRAHYEADRASYDEHNGAGAFMKYYGQHPFQYDNIYGPGAWERDFNSH